MIVGQQQFVEATEDAARDLASGGVAWIRFTRDDNTGKATVTRIDPARVQLAPETGPDAPCSHCGKPATTAYCPMGGCPLGADF